VVNKSRGRRGSGQEHGNMSQDNGDVDGDSRKMREYPGSDGASPTPPRDLDTDCPQSAVT
jgi:hypothetical protein